MSFNYLYNNSNLNPTNVSNLNTVNTSYLDLRLSYGDIGKQFCDIYYNLYDTNFTGLNDLYLQNCCITYLDEEFIGFNNFNNRLKFNGLNKFIHHSININAQPMSDSLMIISVSGAISANDSIFKNRFSETIVLQKFENNRLYIINSVFKLLD